MVRVVGVVRMVRIVVIRGGPLNCNNAINIQYLICNMQPPCQHSCLVLLRCWFVSAPASLVVTRKGRLLRRLCVAPLRETPAAAAQCPSTRVTTAIVGGAYRSCCTRTITYPACFVNDTTRVPATQKKVAATLNGVTFSFSKQIENKKTRTGAVWYKAVFPATAVCANDKYLVDGRNVPKQRVSIHESCLTAATRVVGAV